MSYQKVYKCDRSITCEVRGCVYIRTHKRLNCRAFYEIPVAEWRKNKQTLALAWKILTLAASGADVSKCREIIKKLRGSK